MAKYLIFNSDGMLVYCADSDTEKDTMVGYSINPVVCTDDQFNDVQKRKKSCTFVDNNLIFNDLDNIIQVQLDDAELARPEEERGSLEDLQAGAIKIIKDHIDDYIKIVENYLRDHSSDYWSSYLESLKNIDQNSITVPSTSSTFEEWLLAQPSFPQKTILQLK
jgi:hypothetical protein|tara:strand:- start:157 stop:648 length:492 start_codon:yes stop_codon:yes gene_type:complete